MKECFKDHPVLCEIETEGSLVYKILTHETLIKSKGTYYIPYLMLVGLLFCASNLKVRAMKFFELCQMDLNP